MRYTANIVEPSSQFDSPSDDTRTVINTPAPSAMSSKELKISVNGLPMNRLIKTRTGATKSAICTLDDIAISTLKFILLRAAI